MEGAMKHATFGLNGEKLMAVDGGLGHSFSFNEAISLQIMCETQAEIDHFWANLTANGGEEVPVVGSKIRLAYHGRWCRQYCTKCSATLTPSAPKGSQKPICK